MRRPDAATVAEYLLGFDLTDEAPRMAETETLSPAALGTQLRAALAARKATNRKFSNVYWGTLIGINPDTITSWCRQFDALTPDRERLLLAMGIDPDAFMRGEIKHITAVLPVTDRQAATEVGQSDFMSLAASIAGTPDEPLVADLMRRLASRRPG